MYCEIVCEGQDACRSNHIYCPASSGSISQAFQNLVIADGTCQLYFSGTNSGKYARVYAGYSRLLNVSAYGQSVLEKGKLHAQQVTDVVMTCGGVR